MAKLIFSSLSRSNLGNLTLILAISTAIKFSENKNPKFMTLESNFGGQKKNEEESNKWMLLGILTKNF